VKPPEVRKQIQSGETAPLYLLEGDDQSRHDLAVEFASVVDEGLRAFNVQSFYANEATTASARDQLIGEILSAARTLPMMAPRRVLIVHEAERLLSPRKAKDDEEAPAPVAAAEKRRKKSLSPAEELEAYFESPEPMTTLVFAAGDLDANRRLVKLLRKNAIAVDAGSLESDAEAAKWIQKRLADDGLTIEPKAVSLLLEFTGRPPGSTGRPLGRIRAEVEKLALYAAGEKTVNARHVQDVVMPQSEPNENFALGRAIWADNARLALRELSALLDDGMPPFMVLGQIRAAVRSLKPDDKAKDALDAVFNTDIALKSSIGDPRYVLECLVVELCSR
jgi:DNA polymerase-3 subunit delta